MDIKLVPLTADDREHYCGEWHSEEEFAENLMRKSSPRI